jgi:NAD(P)-dependent dehydrogenase (short-subunit alcohol dehydrogenase family)
MGRRPSWGIRSRARHSLPYLVEVEPPIRDCGCPGANELVAELARLGAKADMVACDVANFESLRRIVEKFDDNRPLRGVVRAAGAEDSGG